MRKNLVTVMVQGREVGISTSETEGGRELMHIDVDGLTLVTLHVRSNDGIALLASSGPSHGGRFYVEDICFDDESAVLVKGGRIEPTERSFVKYVHMNLVSGKDGEEE